ncbi:hypothetical protein [uncultured Clostridium sp.]|uniref:hypothetical protein n=1 Tax=uncultured Clostridium sp. TaxID=59620 RepID=UPI0026135BE5|nr:hypothetical protein [uncultured Clostridium sp.]
MKWYIEEENEVTSFNKKSYSIKIKEEIVGDEVLLNTYIDGELVNKLTRNKIEEKIEKLKKNDDYEIEELVRNSENLLSSSAQDFFRYIKFKTIYNIVISDVVTTENYILQYKYLVFFLEDTKKQKCILKDEITDMIFEAGIWILIFNELKKRLNQD